ncbi:MAG: GAF domain-containing sensor histidine kinase, partial [Bdellovibrionota bacterium]
MGNSANSADTAAAVLLAKNLAMALETGETLRPLLNNLIAKACELTGARYGAMGVLDLKKTGLADFITFGISEETARKIGHLPEGRGLLGAVIQSKGPIRVRRLSEDPRSSGFPPNHPPMVSFLGVPLRIGSEVFGNFYLTDKDSGAEFTAEDESLVENLGIQAALAVGYARHIDLLEAERKQTALRTLELNRLRDEFAAIVAHDLRNPVQAIASQVELILRKSNPGAVDIPVPRSTLNQIQSCGFRLGQMASDLLDAARVDVNRVALDRQESDPAKMLPEILNEIRSTLGGRKVSLRISAGIPKILLDRNRIAQILANLLENSDKYSTPGEPV